MSERVTCPVCGAVNDAEPKGILIEWESSTTRMIGSSWFQEIDATDDQIRTFWNATHPTKAIRRIWRNQEIPELEKEVQP